MTRSIQRLLSAAAALILAVPVLLNASVNTAQPAALESRVRHELLMLPWYSVFDDIRYQVNGNDVTLSGAVTRPILKSDAENVVKNIRGVEHVTNDIQVLPLSGFDDRIRLAEARAIFGDSWLSRYSWGANPPLHIIVDNGHVTLEGVVANQADKNLAGIRANSVSGVFSVTNNLRVEKS